MNAAPFLMLLAVSLALPAAAVTITGRPEVIANGQPMYITIRGLPNQSSFSLYVEADSPVQPDSEFRFQMSQFTMPFALKESSITATLSGTSQNRLEVMKGSTIVSVSGKSTDGAYTVTKTYDITPGTYDYFRLSGTSRDTSREITAKLQLTGTKQGPADSEISFVVEGLTSGTTITLAAMVDGNQVLYRTVPVGGPSPATGSPAAPAATPPTPEEWTTFSSADGAVSVTVSSAGQIAFLKTPAMNITTGMQVVSGPYSLLPADRVFLPPGRIQFKIPDRASPDGLAIASWTGERWAILNSTVGDGAVSAPLTAAGTYALFGPVLQKTVAATTLHTPPPVTMEPSQSPTTRAQIGPLTLVLAVGAGCVLAMRRRR